MPKTSGQLQLHPGIGQGLKYPRVVLGDGLGHSERYVLGLLTVEAATGKVVLPSLLDGCEER